MSNTETFQTKLDEVKRLYTLLMNSPQTRHVKSDFHTELQKDIENGWLNGLILTLRKYEAKLTGHSHAAYIM
jgi:hypothetical protein